MRVRLTTPVAAQNFYVSTNGSDGNAGTLAAPFKTLEKARDTVRALSRPLPSGGVTVWLRGGIFYRTNTLMLTNVNDSGTLTAPVVYRSYSNEVAVISGGKSITAAGWSALDFTQTNRVAPGVNPTNIFEMDLTTTGVMHATNFPADFGQWTTFNIYSQNNDGGLCELFFNGQRQFLSRYPNHSLVNDDLFTTNMTMDVVAKGLVNSNVTLIYSGDSTNCLNYPGTYTNSGGTMVAVGGGFIPTATFVVNGGTVVSSWYGANTASTDGGLHFLRCNLEVDSGLLYAKVWGAGLAPGFDATFAMNGGNDLLRPRPWQSQRRGRAGSLQRQHHRHADRRRDYSRRFDEQ